MQPGLGRVQGTFGTLAGAGSGLDMLRVLWQPQPLDPANRVYLICPTYSSSPLAVNATASMFVVPRSHLFGTSYADMLVQELQGMLESSKSFQVVLVRV